MIRMQKQATVFNLLFSPFVQLRFHFQLDLFLSVMMDLFSHSFIYSKVSSVYSVPGTQATKVNKKHSLPSKTL